MEHPVYSQKEFFTLILFVRLCCWWSAKLYFIKIDNIVCGKSTALNQIFICPAFFSTWVKNIKIKEIVVFLEYMRVINLLLFPKVLLLFHVFDITISFFTFSSF
jgi:hypothetical protein